MITSVWFFGCYWAFGLLGLWASDVSAYLYISDFRLYVVIYILDVYFIYWISSVEVDFQIFINGDFRYFYLSYYFYYYVNRDVTNTLIFKNTLTSVILNVTKYTST